MQLMPFIFPHFLSQDGDVDEDKNYFAVEPNIFRSVRNASGCQYVHPQFLPPGRCGISLSRMCKCFYFSLDTCVNMAMVPQPSSKDTPFHHSVVFNRVCRPFPRIILIEGGSRISNAAFPCLSSLSPVTRILVRFPNYIVCNSRGWGPWLLLSPYPIPNGSNPIWSSLSIFAIKVFSRGILG